MILSPATEAWHDKNVGFRNSHGAMSTSDARAGKGVRRIFSPTDHFRNHRAISKALQKNKSTPYG
jgi:hypothetical protein